MKQLPLTLSLSLARHVESAWSKARGEKYYNELRSSGGGGQFCCCRRSADRPDDSGTKESRSFILRLTQLFCCFSEKRTRLRRQPPIPPAMMMTIARAVLLPLAFPYTVGRSFVSLYLGSACTFT